MSKVKVELNQTGVRELLQSSEVMSVVKSEAEQRAALVGAGYEVSTFVGRTRVNASYISAVSDEAQQDNLENNTLLRAIS